MNIGEKIKSSRISLGLTQEELALAVGTKKQTIHKYETGIIANIPATKIKAIADKLQTTPAYLMGWEPDISTDGRAGADPEPLQVTEAEKNLLHRYRKLNTLGQDKAEEYISDLSENPKYTLTKNSFNPLNTVKIAAHDGSTKEVKDIPVTEMIKREISKKQKNSSTVQSDTETN